MKAIQFHASIPRYLLGLSFGRLFPNLLWSGLSCTRLFDVPEIKLPSSDWIRINTCLGGICGSDIGTIYLNASPYFSAFTSFPYTFGHENLGLISDVSPALGEWKKGERVVVEPLLWCQPRGFEKFCRYCARGEINRCERITDGAIDPGLMLGICRGTGGSWSSSFIAHHSQLFRIPEGVSDENALMVEPLAVGVHAVLQARPGDGQTVLIVGAGTIGLVTLAAIRALGFGARVIVLARHEFQAQAAYKLGANEVILANHRSEYYAEISRFTGARVLQPMIGKRVCIGGADITFECAGNHGSLDDALRLTRNGGKVILVGMPGIVRGVDWSSIFIQELDVQAAYTYNHAENWEGRQWKTFDLVIELLSSRKLDLSWMVTHKFKLDDYANAFKLLKSRGREFVLKAAFTFG